MPLKEFTAKQFFGRKHEIDVLRRAASEAGTGDAGSIILLGKRGIGKTELLKRLYIQLFNQPDGAIPFYYTVKTAFRSIEEFSRDYLSSFILQSIAYLRKDASLVTSGIYSLEDLKGLADDSDLQWVAAIIDHYRAIQEAGDPLKLFLSVISAANQAYLKGGMPVVVIIDDFHKIRKLCELNADKYSRDFWMLFENAIKFRHAPHILAGFQPELQKMFFEESCLGEHLEIISLSGLGRQDAAELFTALCEKYGLSFEPGVPALVDVFGGNPFYMKSFVQSARQTVRSLTVEEFWEIYVREITGGKTCTYWTSILKTYIPRFELRKPCLRVLHHLAEDSADDVFAHLTEQLSIERADLDHIIDLLQTSGTVDMGFSTLELTDDRVLTGVIKALYHREICRDPVEQIKEIVFNDDRKHAAVTETPSFDIIIPAAPEAELVAVSSLEQVARHFKLPPAVTGQLQVALIELVAVVLASNGTASHRYQVKFGVSGSVFSMEVITPRKDFELTEDESSRIRPYLDGMRVEPVLNGTKIVMTREMK